METARESEVMRKVTYEALDERLGAVLSMRGRPLSGLAVALVDGGKIVHEGYWGARRFLYGERTNAGEPSPEGETVGCEPVDKDTRWRVASLSKPFTALGALRLVELGKLDLDADVSECLGYPLRNPAFPDAPINLRMLLSHTSSLRDAEYYFPPLSHGLWELFLPGGRHYEGGIHYAKPIPGGDLAPGVRYAYCNLGYAVVGEMIEKASGQRFDLYMQDLIFGPLGIDGGFNPLLVSDRHFPDICPIYRKQKSEGEPWDPEGPWYPQTDNFCGVRPALPVRVPEGEAVSPGVTSANIAGLVPKGDRIVPGADPASGGMSTPGGGRALSLADYEIGTNGSLFSPQGGMRISAHDLARLMMLFIDGGVGSLESGERKRLFMPASIDAMVRPAWWRDDTRRGDTRREDTRRVATIRGATSGNYDPAEETGPRTWEFGLGLYRGEGPDGGPGLWGHHGDAYGFLGGMFFDRERRSGYVYLIGGTGADPERNRGTHSRLSVWEEKIRSLIEEALSL